MRSSLPLLLCKAILAVAALFFAFTVGLAKSDQAGDPGWPREHVRDGNHLITYQPQVDEWTKFKELTWRMAVSITPKREKAALGVLDMKGQTLVDGDNKLVIIIDPEITGAHFPGTDAATAEKLTAVAKTFVPPNITVSLHRVIASLPKVNPPQTVEVKSNE